MKDTKVKVDGILHLKKVSVYGGDVPFMTFHVDKPNGDTETVGKLWCAQGVLSFEGNVKESAEIFFKALIHKIEYFLEAQKEIKNDS